MRLLALGVMLVCAPYCMAERIYKESGGYVVMEMENTQSPLGNWNLRAPNLEGYPAGAIGAGHLEYIGPFREANSPLEYRFQINQPGNYALVLRAHKRLLGNPGDQNNDAYVRMAGDFTSGNPNVPLSALTQDTKLFGGAADGWGKAQRLDGNGAHSEEPIYNFKAGETYTLTISDRSTRFNIDRIFLHHDSTNLPLSKMASLPESSLVNIIPPTLPSRFDFQAPEYSDGPLDGQAGWMSEDSWFVADATGAGRTSTSSINEIATFGAPITLEEGESFSYSMNFEFLGDISQQINGFTSTFQTGLKADRGASAHLPTDSDGQDGRAAGADVNLELQSNGGGDHSYRLLDNFTPVAGMGSIDAVEDAPLNGGDELLLDFSLTLGADAASTTIDLLLQNLTDGVATNAGTIHGIDPEIYDALTGNGAYLYYQSSDYSNNNSGITGVQINSILLDQPSLRLAGDYNGDGVVTAADYTVWRDNLGQSGLGLVADADRSGGVDAADYSIWKLQFGASAPPPNSALQRAPVPEPAAYLLLLASFAGGIVGGNLRGHRVIVG